MQHDTPNEADLNAEDDAALRDVPVLPHAPRHGERVELDIERLGAAGEGEGALVLRVGPERALKRYVVAVRKAMVGDRVRAIIESRRRGRYTARVDEVLRPAAGRVAPRCPHFGAREEPGRGCGGCTLQALDYPAQLTVKRDLVQRAMANRGLDPALVAPVRGAEDPWRYRNKMEFTFGDDRERRFALGLFPTGWHNEVIALTTCHLVSTVTAGVVPRVRDWAEARGLSTYRPRDDRGFLRQLTIREGKRTDERLVELVTSPDVAVETVSGPRQAEEVARELLTAVAGFAEELGGRVSSAWWTRHVAIAGQATRLESTLVAGTPVFNDELLLPDGSALRFGIHPRAFFQPNPRQAEVLVAEVLARLGAARTVLDLYCGTGTLALCVARSVDHVVGVEIVADAIDNAVANARANGLDNVTFLVGDVGEVLREHADAPWRAEVDAVVVDPPRAGLMPKAVEQLAAIAPPRIVYVSCSPASLARDIVALRAAGYEVEGAIQPVDLFPHTFHVENVVTLRRTSDAALIPASEG
ncbi:MAG: 23S rRNA (uracil(1939)-C(5))-methyltransferase RlmD [Deltaproteobacteria bacterium HGW-Deltaproteobacteria-14]|jgi:23S rRNA (uracil1939-C5)-methyltransferase|nr:MAG: 23S rRNA (uracil(1939)-C(5))-methyltransferase RlmD [Deltaproteobacteria bacterium HGW-Deltaproteobacteria-14]